MSTGTGIRSARLWARCTVHDLSKLTGIDMDRLNDLERDIVQPTTDELSAIYTATGVKLPAPPQPGRPTPAPNVGDLLKAAREADRLASSALDSWRRADVRTASESAQVGRLMDAADKAWQRYGRAVGATQEGVQP